MIPVKRTDGELTLKIIGLIKYWCKFEEYYGKDNLVNIVFNKTYQLNSFDGCAEKVNSRMRIRREGLRMLE